MTTGAIKCRKNRGMKVSVEEWKNRKWEANNLR
jgi:hypothetical protein